MRKNEDDDFTRKKTFFITQCGKLSISSVSQILREINFKDFGGAKSAILTDLEAVNFHFLMKFCIF